MTVSSVGPFLLSSVFLPSTAISSSSSSSSSRTTLTAPSVVSSLATVVVDDAEGLQPRDVLQPPQQPRSHSDLCLFHLRGGASDATNATTTSSSETTTTTTRPSNQSTNKHKKKKKKKQHKQQQQPKSNTKKSTTTLPIVQEILSHDNYYDILGLDAKKHTQKPPTSAIKKAYRQRALLTHPDKTQGDRRAFDKVSRAYEVLSDPQSKQWYDQYGETGLDENKNKNHGFGGKTAEDLFRTFFGGGTSFSPFGGARSQQQQQPLQRFELQVDLEQLYKGVHNLTLNTLGQEIVVDIPKGSLDRSVLSVHNHLQFIIVQRPHPRFTRAGHDLLCTLVITMSESLTGVRRTLTHLDGTSFTVVSAGASNNNIPHNTKKNICLALPILHGDVQKLTGHGMPKDATGLEYGDLYVQFHVARPSTKQGDAKDKKNTAAADASSLWTKEEVVTLRNLLQKLDGTAASFSTTTTARTENQELEDVWPFEGSQTKDKNKTTQPTKVHRLLPSSYDAFEQSRQRQRRSQRSFQDDPSFGPRPFFWSSGSSNPFMADPTFGHTDADEQCRQM